MWLSSLFIIIHVIVKVKGAYIDCGEYEYEDECEEEQSECYQFDFSKSIKSLLSFSDYCKSDGDYCFVKRVDVNIFEITSWHFEDSKYNLEYGCGKCKDSNDCVDYYCDKKSCDPSTYDKSEIFKTYHKCIVKFTDSSSIHESRLFYELCRYGFKECYLTFEDNADRSNLLSYKGGCGNCLNKKNCLDCNKLNCYEKQDLEKRIYCYGRKYGEDEQKKECFNDYCYISIDYVMGGDSKNAFEKFIEQGCGGCKANNKIPCIECNNKFCNSESLFENVQLCWENDGKAQKCDKQKSCYYALSWGHKVYRGCGETPNDEIPFVVCTKQLCNTKEFFDNTLFCLIKGKEDLESRKGINKCDKECFVHRHSDGKLEQGCDKCPPKTEKICKTCKTKYCNVEREVPIYCWKNNGKTCTNEVDDFNCFTARADNNEVNKGCGKCPYTTCKPCKGNLCNNENDFHYYCLDSDGTSLKECAKKDCFVAKENNELGSTGGCGTCDENKIEKSCVDCDGLKCNTRKLLKKSLFCY
ncbi:hypothetical protein ACQ4LE_001202, partial [Meloidogyne hapla]